MNRGEPRPKIGTPRPSRELGVDVRHEFDKLTRRLAGLGVVTVVDGLSLELAALALADCWRYEAAIRAGGATYTTTTPQGSEMVRVRPEVALLSDAWRRASTALREFGLTPASRANVTAHHPASASPWDGILADPLERFFAKKPQPTRGPG